MRRYDLTPLLRSSIGFDRFDRLFDATQRGGSGSGFPPYNIVKSDDNRYGITMAVAGLKEEDLDVTVREGMLIVSAQQNDAPNGVSYLHRGIAARAFERRFELADDVRVIGANLENGLLHIELEREVPEHKRPRRIDIKRNDDSRKAA